MDDFSDYDAHAARLQRQADEAMGVFLKVLPESKRVQLLGKSKKTSRPDRPRQVGLDKDIAESPAASFSPDIAAEVDSLPDTLMEQFRFLRRCDAAPLAFMIDERVAAESERYNTWLLTRVTARLIEAGNAKMVAVSMAYALSVPVVYVNGVLCRTQMQAAEALGCSRSNLSKEVTTSADWLGIDEGIHMKKPSAVESCRMAQTINHWRKRFYGAE